MLAVLLLFALSASAQQSTKTAFYFAGGFSAQMSPDRFKDNWNTGLSLGGGLEIKFNKFISLVPRIYYYTYPLDEDAFKKLLESEYDYSIEGLSLDGGSQNMVDFGADARLSVPGSVVNIFTPYLIGSIGLTHISFSELNITGGATDETLKIDKSETDFTVNLGAGMKAEIVPQVTVFVECRYALIFSDPRNFSHIPVHVGISLMK